MVQPCDNGGLKLVHLSREGRKGRFDKKKRQKKKQQFDLFQAKLLIVWEVQYIMLQRTTVFQFSKYILSSLGVYYRRAPLYVIIVRFLAIL